MSFSRRKKKAPEASEVKLVIIGGEGVGKSALRIQFVCYHFLEEYDPTIEDGYRKQVNIDDEIFVLEIWDTVAGDDRVEYMRTGEGFLCAYDITSRLSFNEVSNLRAQIVKVKKSYDFAMVVVGNKCDLDSERQVSKDEGQTLAKNFTCPFFETSAKLKTNVEESFFELIREIRKHGVKTDEKKGSCIIA